MLTPGITHPETKGKSNKMMDIMNHRKMNTLSRDGSVNESVTESMTESESNSATPANYKHNAQRKVTIMPPIPSTGTKPIKFKKTTSSKQLRSYDTSRVYTGF